MAAIKPEDFERLAKGLSDKEIIEAAIEAGFLPERDIEIGDEVELPLWLAELLQKTGIAEIVKVCGGQK